MWTKKFLFFLICSVILRCIGKTCCLHEIEPLTPTLQFHAEFIFRIALVSLRWVISLKLTNNAILLKKKDFKNVDDVLTEEFLQSSFKMLLNSHFVPTGNWLCF